MTEPLSDLATASRWSWLFGRRLPILVGVGVLLALALYYPVGAWRASVVDDNPHFAPGPLAPGQSQAIALAALLIRREIDQHGWAPNKPFFMPAAILTDMPNFQKGVMVGIGRFAREVSDLDGDLARAAELLQYPATTWMIDPSAPWAHTLSAEKQYRNAARGFESFNQKLAAQQGNFPHRRDRLAALVEAFADELDQQAALLDVVASGTSWFDRQPERVFYSGKGRAYAALMLLTSLGEDFAPDLAETGLTESWRKMLASVSAAALPAPWLVLTGSPDANFWPNHPAQQGFYLLRAKSRLVELAGRLRG